MSPQNPSELTAAFLVIGDEILSGRTHEKNIAVLAKKLTEHGIALRQVRVIGDNHEEIVNHTRELSLAHTSLFTSGGIGPTHDDVTAAAIAAAYNRPLIAHTATTEALAAHFKKSQRPFTAERHKMACFPEGASPIPCDLSVAPGFYIENTFVLAGVPQIFEAMLPACFDMLEKGREILTLDFGSVLGEGDISAPLKSLATEFSDVSIGSYPHFYDDRIASLTNKSTNNIRNTENQRPLVTIVFRHHDSQRLSQVGAAWQIIYTKLLAETDRRP